jgi:hypothetical protein
MFGSAHEGERLAAVNLANKELARNKLTWADIIGAAAAPPQHRQPPRTPLVPAGTPCRLRVQIRPGKDNVLTRSSDRKSRARYLLLAFTVIEPEQFAGAQFLDRFGTHGRDGQPTGYYAEQGRAHIKRMAQSAGIKLARPGDLDGIEIAALVGIRQRSFKNATGESENHIAAIVVPGREGGAS